MKRKNVFISFCLSLLISCFAIIADMKSAEALVELPPLEPKVNADIAGTYMISRVWPFKYGRYDGKVVDPLRNYIGRLVRVTAWDESENYSLGRSVSSVYIDGYVIPNPDEIDPKHIDDRYEVDDIIRLAGKDILDFAFDDEKPNEYQRDSSGGGGHPCHLDLFYGDAYKYKYYTNDIGPFIVIKPDSLLFYHYADYGHDERFYYVENIVREPILELKRIE